MNLKTPIKVAVIGAGVTSQRIHLVALQELSKENLVSLQIVCDINRTVAKKAKEKFGFMEYEHKAEKVFTREDIDAVYIFGTAQMHYEYAKKSLENGKHVFVEKPPSINSSCALEIARLADKKDLVVMVGFNRRFQKSLIKAKDMVVNDSNIYSVEAVFDKPALLKVAPYGAGTWLSSNSIHSIDALQFFSESLPRELYSTHNIAAGEVPQNFSALIIWESGLHGSFLSNNSAGRQNEEYILHGGGISVSVKNRAVERCEGDVCKNIEVSGSRGFSEEHKHFIDVLSDKDKLQSSMFDGAVALYLTELIEEGYRGVIDWSKFKEVEEKDIISKDEKKDLVESILVLNPTTLKSNLSRLTNDYNLVYEDQIATLSDSEKENIIAIVTGRGGTPISVELLDKLPNIKVIGVVGASLKKYNVDEAVSCGIPVLNASNIYAEAVAEFTVMLMILGLRNASRSHEVMRGGGWGIVLEKGLKNKLRKSLEKARDNKILIRLRPVLKPLWNIAKRYIYREKNGDVKSSAGRGGSNNLKGSTIGIVGYGEIAKKVVKFLEPFDCTVKVYSQYLTKEEAHKTGVVVSTLSEVLRCDVVTLHRGLSSRTVHSFGRKEINTMRPNSVFINTARGELVDTKALIRRLRKGDMFACLDVFEEEPLKVRSELRKLSNVFLTSHISGSTTQMYEDSATGLVEKLLGYLNEEDIYTVSSVEQLKNMT